MNRTKIETADLTFNPVTGCHNTCSYCYARGIATRFKGTKAWPDGFLPTFHPKRLEEIGEPKPGEKVMVCSMGELFGDWVPEEWTRQVIEVTRQRPDVTFQFFTKYPHNLSKFNPWPDNAWVGVSVTQADQFRAAYEGLDCANARVKFLSIEPMLGPLGRDALDLIGGRDYHWLDWLIIGGQTQPQRLPEPSGVEDIVAAADSGGVAVFIEDSLTKWVIAPGMGYPQRKEWPK